jgi:hypothetical protein
MTTRRWLINLGLLALLVLLLLAVRLDTRETERRTRLTSLAPEDIARIDLHRAGEPTIQLQREDTGWQMRAPFAVTADPAAVAKLLPVADARASRILPAAGLDLTELGLEPAPLRVLLNGLELRFGGTEPVAAQRYVQVGDMVHLVDDRFLPGLMTPATALVSRRLLPPDFSPGLGELDGGPVSAGDLAPLADAVAVRVTPSEQHLDDVLGGRLLRIASGDGGHGLEFLVGDGGTRWTRVDTALSWIFATPPVDAVREPSATWAAPSPAPAQAPAAPVSVMPRAAPAPAAAEPAAASLPVQRLAPPAPGSEPVEQRPTAAVPNLRGMAPAPDPSALPPQGVDPFAPPSQQAQPAPLTPDGESPAPLRTEKLRP